MFFLYVKVDEGAYDKNTLCTKYKLFKTLLLQMLPNFIHRDALLHIFE